MTTEHGVPDRLESRKDMPPAWRCDSETPMLTHTHSPQESPFGSWILAGIVGHLIAIGAIATLVQGLAEPGTGADLYPLVAWALIGGSAGVVVGAAQWPALRRAFGELCVREWILASALGGALVGTLAWGAGAGNPLDVSSLPTIILAASAFGLVAGGTLGMTQAWALRRRPHVAGRWCVGNAAGWALGLLVAVAGVLGAVLGPDVAPITVAIMATGVAVTGGLVAWATRFALGRHAERPPWPATPCRRH